MSEWPLFDPIFRIPFFTGLLLTVSLSLIGAWLRMRNEWLAALGLSHMAAAGGIAAAVLHIPPLAGAFTATGLATCARVALPRVGNSHYGIMMLAGWSFTFIMGSYMDHGFVVAETLVRGQLYFTYAPHLLGALVLFAVLLALVSWLSPKLLTARFFPDYHQANRIPVWPYATAYHALVMAATVLGTISMGAFPAFALLFIPSWIGFVLVDGWNRSLRLSVCIGVTAYIISFALAMMVDLPFGPVLTAMLVCMSSLRLLTALRRQSTPVSGDELQRNYLPPATEKFRSR
jgi:zinc/manganese transport system permease protein